MVKLVIIDERQTVYVSYKTAHVTQTQMKKTNVVIS